MCVFLTVRIREYAQEVPFVLQQKEEEEEKRHLVGNINSLCMHPFYGHCLAAHFINYTALKRCKDLLQLHLERRLYLVNMP